MEDVAEAALFGCFVDFVVTALKDIFGIASHKQNL
jgi:hypothetical protein